MELTLEEIVLYDKNDLKNKLSGEFAKIITVLTCGE